jgi:hypothetical protein
VASKQAVRPLKTFLDKQWSSHLRKIVSLEKLSVSFCKESELPYIFSSYVNPWIMVSELI